ncbi:MAG: hypothetical protein M3R08_07990 [Bacteroidota bacterium]|nr:hypothetical protein [Bacteroidota bacterium]
MALVACRHEVDEVVPAMINSHVEVVMAPPCDPITVTYSGTIIPIIQQHCTTCHSGPVTISFSTYSGLFAVAQDGRLAASIQQLPEAIPMPPGGPQNKLAHCEFQAILTWIEAGSPDN